MANLLTLKKLKGVHLVDRGAALGARVLFLKRAQETAMSLKDTILKKIGEIIDQHMTTPVDDPDAKRVDAMKRATELIAKFQKESASPADLQAQLEAAMAGVDEKTKAALMAVFTLAYQAMPPAAAPKAAPAAPAPAPGAPAVPAKADTAAGAAPIPPTAPNPKEIPMTAKKLEDVLKSLDAESRAALEPVLKAKETAEAKVAEAAAENEKLAKRLGEVEGTVAEQIAKSEMAVEVEVAKRFPHVPGDITKRAARLLGIRKTQGDAGYKDAIQELTASEVMFAKSLGKTKGTSAGDESTTDANEPKEAYEKLKAMEDEVVAKSGGKIKKSAARRKIREENPELYAQAREYSVEN